MSIFKKTLKERSLLQIQALLEKAQEQLNEIDNTITFLKQEKISTEDQKYRNPERGATLLREGKIKILTDLKKNINKILGEF